MRRRLWLALRRMGGVVRKELVELVRQPAMVASLVVGPLVILLLFGASVRPTDPAVRTTFVAPEDDTSLAEVVREYADSQSDRLTIDGVVTDELAALADLRRGDVDVVVVFPDDPQQALEGGDRAEIRVVHRFIDPLEAQAIELFTRGAVDDLNDILLELVIGSAQDSAEVVLEDLDDDDSALGGALGDDVDAELLLEEAELDLEGATVRLETLLQLDPGDVAAPLVGTSDAVGGTVTTSQFYAPAVVALILQHLTLTFVALARTRERELGTEELLTVSPLRPAERVAGQALAYLLFGAALAAVLLAAVVVLLGAPLRGGVADVALVVVLELVASIGMGLLLARVATSTTQVVQGSMLLLLLSVFFGGLLLSPERLLPWARPIGWALPMHHALEGLRDSMLRGVVLSGPPLLWLAGIGVVLMGLALLVPMRRRLG